MNKRDIIMIVALVLVAVMIPAGSIFAQTQSIDLDSGAQRDGNFISVDQEFQTKDGSTRELYMTGLKEGNYEKMIACLQDYYSDSEGAPALKILDDSFCDAEKWDCEDFAAGYDAGHCWAASASNMLWISGWTRGFLDDSKTFSSEDEIFRIYNSSFDDSGADIDRGLDWFFMGEYFMTGMGKSASLYSPKAEDGYLKRFVSSLAQTKYNLIEEPAGIENLLKVGPAAQGTGAGQSVFQASVGFMREGDDFTVSEHSVTAAGLIIDPSIDPQAENWQDRYRAIIIIDSDNDAYPSAEEKKQIEGLTGDALIAKKAELKAARPNSYTIYPLKYYTDNNGVSGWLLDGYIGIEMDETASTTGLYSVNELPLPSEDLIDRNTETEGTMDHMNDPDFTLDTLFMTASSTGYRDPYYSLPADAKVTEFPEGDPIRLNYFVANRSQKTLKEYQEGKPLILDWKVTRDETGEVMAEGKHTAQLPIFAGYDGGSNKADLVTVNQTDSGIKCWPMGSYTLTAELNKDRAIAESYYRNNLPQTLQFTVISKDGTNVIHAGNGKKSYKAAKLKKNARLFTIAKVVRLQDTKGEITYKVKPVNARSKKALSYQAKAGKIKVKKKTGKGTYKVRVTIMDAGTDIYDPAEKTVTITVRVK